MTKFRPAMKGCILTTALLACFLSLEGVSGYSRGAPDTTCLSMMPGHGLTRQSSTSPYTITPGAVSVEGGQKILVTMQAPDDDPGFKGFIVQARNSNNDTEIVGSFETTDYNYITCVKGFNNAVTHSSSTAKPKVLLEWQAPSDYEGDVVFKASFVKTYDTFWVGVTSEKVTVTKAEALQANPAPETTTTTTTTTITTTTTTTLPPSPSVSLVDATAISPENAGDLVINVVDAPGVDVPVVGNDISVIEEEGPSPTPPVVPSTSSPTSLSSPSTADSSSNSSTFSEGITDSSVDSVPTESTTQSGGRARPAIRFGIRKKLKTTTTQAPTTAKATPAPEKSTTSVPIENLSPEIASLKNTMQNVYLGCGSNKGCFGFPDKCVDKENCDMLMTYSKVSSGYQFEIMGTTGSSPGYIAAGLSDDAKMGSDSVMACTASQSTANIMMAINKGKSNQPLAEVQKGLSDIRAAQVDGRVYCSFIRQEFTEIEGVEYNLADDRFHLMLARGPLASNGFLQFHDKKVVSSGTSSLDAFEAIEASSDLFLKLHAVFMIGAWVCAASCGILLARYYKQTWLRGKCCGIDVWFHFHRLFMGLTWGLTIAGFVLIVLYKGGWTDLPITENPHPIIGIISIGLCFIQPFMALCRCGPNHKKRPIFNWFHWFVGNSAQILGLTAIFYGLELVSAPSWSWFVLIVFIAFHCVWHLILSVGQCVSDSKSEKSNNVFPMKDMNGGRNPLHPVEKREDAPGGTFRKTMLAFYLIVTWLITAILIVIVLFGEEQLREWKLLFWEYI